MKQHGTYLAQHMSTGSLKPESRRRSGGCKQFCLFIHPVRPYGDQDNVVLDETGAQNIRFKCLRASSAPIEDIRAISEAAMGCKA